MDKDTGVVGIGKKVDQRQYPRKRSARRLATPSHGSAEVKADQGLRARFRMPSAVSRTHSGANSVRLRCLSFPPLFPGPGAKPMRRALRAEKSTTDKSYPPLPRHGVLVVPSLGRRLSVLPGATEDDGHRHQRRQGQYFHRDEVGRRRRVPPSMVHPEMPMALAYETGSLSAGCIRGDDHVAGNSFSSSFSSLRCSVALAAASAATATAMVTAASGSSALS